VNDIPDSSPIRAVKLPDTPVASRTLMFPVKVLVGIAALIVVTHPTV
jgi:hypothetical protein